MSKSRRQFLAQASLLVGAAVASRASVQNPAEAQQQQKPTEAPPGAPPAFGTAPAVGPEVTPATFAEAEKLAQVTMTPAERETAAGNWRRAMAPLLERRTGPKTVTLDPDVAPPTRWEPSLLSR